MSRLFEALQRSEGEGFSIEFPAPEPAASELLKALPEAGSEQMPADTLQPFAAMVAEGPQAAVATQFVPLPLNVARESRLVSLTDKESLPAEKFRFLGVRLRQLRQTRPLKKLLITSTVPEEGKSLVSANIAVTLARKKPQSVLLLEGDLRRPVLAREFGVSAPTGLSEWLRSQPTQLPVIYNLEEAGLCFLPAGSPPDNPLELMQSGRLSELFESLTASFDWIVIDSPPILPLGDTSVWTRLAEGVMLVVREGVTQREQLKRGLEALDQSKLLGTVLNDCSSVDRDHYYQRYGPAAQPQGAA